MSIIQSLFAIRRTVAPEPLVYIYDTTISKSPVDSWIGWTVNNEGYIWINGNGSAWANTGVAWLLSGAVGDYEGRHTVLSGTVDQFPNGGPNTWISLANNPYFQTQNKSAVTKFEIRLVSTSEIIATANITFDHTLPA